MYARYMEPHPDPEKASERAVLVCAGPSDTDEPIIPAFHYSLSARELCTTWVLCTCDTLTWCCVVVVCLLSKGMVLEHGKRYRVINRKV